MILKITHKNATKNRKFENDSKNRLKIISKNTKFANN